MKRIAIITTRQNFVWKSMQEVFPAIEKCWLETDCETKVINIDHEPIRDHLKYIMTCDALIIIAFNETIARFIRHIRKTLEIEIPIILHLYGYATVGFWPLARFNVLECLTESDQFIGTCQGDLNCMAACLENAKTLNIPYPHVPYEFEKIKIDGKKCFAYVGRISDQKNVDQLIDAYYLLKTRIKNVPPFYIFGDEDKLGWPNFGKEATNCLEQIKLKIEHYQLESDVSLMGFMDREEIYKILGTEHIFVSASTHSDENFGMAAMRSLSVGGKAVLTAWGGHYNFQTHHPDRVLLAKIILDGGRPRVDSHHLSYNMEKMLASSCHKNDLNLANYFSDQAVREQFNVMIKNLPAFNNQALRLTSMGEKIKTQQSEFEKMGFQQRAFSGFDDVAFLKLTKAYTDHLDDDK